tara:strand:+ start:489 stop:809 length:321 start_codon:yes stop_codon:yes gene_type:complete
MNTYVVNRYNKPTPGATSQLISIPTSDNTVKEFTAYQENTKVIFLSVQGAAVGMTIDGTGPGDSSSHRLFAGNQYYFSAELMKNAKFKRISSGSATVNLYASELTN